jgi:hypothetical protein
VLAPVHSLADGTFRAVHRTYVEQDAAGAWHNARKLKPPKSFLGPVSGHIIPLIDGVGRPWARKA